MDRSIKEKHNRKGDLDQRPKKFTESPNVLEVADTLLENEARFMLSNEGARDLPLYTEHP